MTQDIPDGEIKQSGDDRFVLNYLMITIMLVSLTIVIVNGIQASLPGWNGNLLIFLSLVITLESLVSFRTIKQITIFDANPIVTRITEWIVILIGIKAITYLFSSPGQLMVDINSWRQDFSTFFFQSDYLVTCIYMLIIWVLAGGFASNLDKLGDDVQLLELERQGYARTNRTDTRRGLMGLIFGLGCVMIFMTTVTQIDLPFIQFLQNPILFNVGLIMLFFVSGFILLARS